jgi:hypothetical protein
MTDQDKLNLVKRWTEEEEEEEGESLALSESTRIILAKQEVYPALIKNIDDIIHLRAFLSEIDDLSIGARESLIQHWRKHRADVEMREKTTLESYTFGGRAEPNPCAAITIDGYGMRADKYNRVQAKVFGTILHHMSCDEVKIHLLEYCPQKNSYMGGSALTISKQPFSVKKREIMEWEILLHYSVEDCYELKEVCSELKEVWRKHFFVAVAVPANMIWLDRIIQESKIAGTEIPHKKIMLCHPSVVISNYVEINPRVIDDALADMEEEKPEEQVVEEETVVEEEEIVVEEGPEEVIEEETVVEVVEDENENEKETNLGKRKRSTTTTTTTTKSTNKKKKRNNKRQKK